MDLVEAAAVPLNVTAAAPLVDLLGEACTRSATTTSPKDSLNGQDC